MWNSSQYADAEGGGYMNSPNQPGRQGGGGQGGGQGGKGPSRMNNIMPCTCAELTAATMSEDSFESPAGVSVSQVTILGNVRYVKRTATRNDYLVDDYTGAPLEVKQFVDNEAEGPEVPTFEEGTYVRVFGHLRNIQGNRGLSAFKIMKVEDLNEISFHMLSVLKARLALGGAAQAGGGQPASGGLANLADPSAAGMNKMEQQILAIIKSNDTDEGASVDQIKQQLRGVPEKRIREILNGLGDEGHIYSSSDEDHFKVVN